MFIVINAIGEEIGSYSITPFDNEKDAIEEFQTQVNDNQMSCDDDGDPSENGRPENGYALDGITIAILEMKNGKQIHIDSETDTIELHPAVQIHSLVEGENSDIRFKRIS